MLPFNNHALTNMYCTAQIVYYKVYLYDEGM